MSLPTAELSVVSKLSLEKSGQVFWVRMCACVHTCVRHMQWDGGHWIYLCACLGA